MVLSLELSLKVPDHGAFSISEITFKVDRDGAFRDFTETELGDPLLRFSLHGGTRVLPQSELDVLSFKNFAEADSHELKLAPSLELGEYLQERLASVLPLK